jgi:hypothetical protein
MEAAMAQGFRTTNANIELVTTDLGIVKDRLVIVEAWKGEQDQRSSRTSAGVRGLSLTDVEQAAQLAQERTAREELALKVDSLHASQETQMAILGRLDAVARNPLVKTMAAMLATAAITWMAAHGVTVR